MSLNKELINKIITVTSKAAISCNKFIGKNDLDKFVNNLDYKTKKFIEETKEYQKKGLEKSKEQIKDLNPLKKSQCL